MKRQALLLCGLALVGACVVEKPGILDAGDDGEDETGAGSEISEGSEPGETGEPEPGPTDGDGCTEALDILVVLDNSKSMAARQRAVTDAFPLLIEGLDQAGVDWRLAVTTTDGGNPWCQTTTPEYGRFVFSSCESRLGEFVVEGNNMQAVACTDICGLSTEQLEAQPTVTDLDPNAKPRPWLQREAGQLNLPAGVEVGDALGCLIPQGTTGCGFEQQLESMRRALARTTDANASEFGFLRDDASLLVLLISDEADCSHRPEFEDAVFGLDGAKTFWEDPSDIATSAICWNAGVECTGDPSGYDDCFAANKDVLGQPGTDEDAVLYPVARYQSVLSAIEQSKRAVDDGHDVAVLAIHGVGVDGTLSYAEGNDPLFQAEFGIGPGCTYGDPNVEDWLGAVPPVRIREVAEHLSSDSLASICAENFDGFMLDVLERFVGAC